MRQWKYFQKRINLEESHQSLKSMQSKKATKNMEGSIKEDNHKNQESGRKSGKNEKQETTKIHGKT